MRKEKMLWRFKNFCVKRYTTKEKKYGDNKRSVRRTAEGLQQSG